jgi:hypothetical protein
MPTLILWISAEQPLWAKQVTKLGVGTSERFSIATPESIRAGLQTVLAPEYRRRAARIARQMTTPRDSVAAAADLVEAAARDTRSSAAQVAHAGRYQPTRSDEMVSAAVDIARCEVMPDRAHQQMIRFDAIHPYDRRIPVAE